MFLSMVEVIKTPKKYISSKYYIFIIVIVRIEKNLTQTIYYNFAQYTYKVLHQNINPLIYPT